MSRSFPRLALVAVLTALVVGLLSPASQAAGTPRVKGVSKAGQDGSSLIVRWRPVSGATYQLRWAGTAKSLRRGAVVSTTQTSAATGALSRGGTWFAQVRAVRGSKAGAWSRPKAMKLQGGQAAGPISGQGLPGAIRFDWSGIKGAARYRVEWNAAWAGMWPGTTYVDGGRGGWVGAGARSSTLAVPGAPGPGDRLLAVEYGNPVFARLQAGNKKSRVTRTSKWIPVFSQAPTPPEGDSVTMGSYNLQWAPQGGPRITAYAANIASHDVDVAALQEATAGTASAVVGALGAPWTAGPDNGGFQSIVYRSDKYQMQDAGSVTIRRRTGPPLITPWIQLRHRGVPNARPFLVVSAHVFAPETGNRVSDNRETGLAAQDLDNGMNAVNASKGLPIIVAGDLQYGREPMTEDPGTLPAQPTLVRRGYYDALAALTKTGIEYSTFNVVNGVNQARQSPNPTGIAGRGDHILVKGVRGALRYQNVANWSHNGLVPSDHNMILAELRIPRR